MPIYEQEYLAPRKKRTRMLHWFKRRSTLTFARDGKTLGILLAMVVGSFFLASIAALSMPTGLGTFIDLLLFIVANALALFLLGVTVSWLLSLLYLPVPRALLSATIYNGALCYYMLDEASMGLTFSLIMTGVFLVTLLMIGLALNSMLYRSKFGYIAVPMSVAWVLFLLFFHPTIEQFESTSSFQANDYITPLAVGNPAEEGEYRVQSFTYGSGRDNHRDEFADEVQLLSRSIDASDYITTWKDWRTTFWGFDQTELPLNGRVWMPEGEGPFPLAMIVHGNHRMENFSDAGYAYLGELLASRGIAMVSIDENFLNFTNWTGIPGDNYRLRAWVMMHHLLQIKDFTASENNPFYNRIDLSRVAVMGHSRGGQAAAIVADYERFFEDDESLDGFETINVESVVAIAPTDVSIDDERPRLNDVNYLTIHGARDGDVNNFRGDRQYGRTSFTGSLDRLKSAVYIADANHSQFNTDWGRADMRLPGGMFLSRKQMMDPEEQREVAKVFISAFLEVTLHNNDQYQPLFMDIRHGEEWLPRTQYVTRYVDSTYERLVSFNRNNDVEEFPQGITASAEGFTEWDKTSTVDRGGNNKAADGVVMEWEDDMSYTLSLPESYVTDADSVEYFSFSMAQMDKELEAPYTGETDPSLELVFSLNDGGEVSISVDALQPIPPSIWTQYTRYPFLEDITRDGKYEEAIEPAFQTYFIPIMMLEEAEASVEDLESITWQFSDGPGRLVIDDIGFFREE
ncbi:hypothetical protein FLK61_33535 [Paenalkalicoccus suaedae]|uniref:Alpha/beta hydrolase n=1 Tax=Paenalkalicoccus suaedae TaxID=2592382 RepID=A0A859FFJ5_9BACI|nr:hypothetical protein [Paenalkalicoccus suaedae]QKS71610.1 hypothetical protein FLK61_33535 [Paenalkalicoccus suaedae]